MRNRRRAAGIQVAKLGGPAMLGYGIFMLASVTMWFFSLYWFLQWWGLLGLLAILFIAPLAALFPFIYWVQEGFPLEYLLIWLVGVGALILGIATSGFLVKRTVKKAQESQAKRARRSEAIDGEVVE